MVVNCPYNIFTNNLGRFCRNVGLSFSVLIQHFFSLQLKISIVINFLEQKKEILQCTLISLLFYFQCEDYCLTSSAFRLTSLLPSQLCVVGHFEFLRTYAAISKLGGWINVPSRSKNAGGIWVRVFLSITQSSNASITDGTLLLCIF